MKGRLSALLVIFLAFVRPVSAHVGSPDVFFDGPVGPYAARVVIRMPPVVPGRAQIEVRLPASKDATEVSFRPLYARTAVKNAPPGEAGAPVFGEAGVYRGELWLMSFGAYGIEIHVGGKAGEGMVQIPVNSAATRQLPLPRYLEVILFALGTLLFGGGLGIVAAASGQSVLAPGLAMDLLHRRKAIAAASIAAVVFALALAGGRLWWKLDEESFRSHLREGAWPDLAANVRRAGGARILELTVGQTAFRPDYALPLLPDHGKAMHLFLVREPQRDVFAHLHPQRRDGKTFEVTLPPLPEGQYRAFCDLTFSDTGVSATASTLVQIPAPTEGASIAPAADPDDSWAAVSPSASAPLVSRAANGDQIAWKLHGPLRVRQDAQLEFAVTDGAGQPVPLEPYMGMMSHAAILRSDGAVFAHLHPTGNFSMAAQSFFAAKIARETAPDSTSAEEMPAEMDHSKMGHGSPAGGAVSSVTLPYEFPAPGDYRVWVQVKVGDRIVTGVFDAAVGP